MSYSLLIIDDDEDIRLILSSVLASIEGLNLRQASSGLEARKILNTQVIDGVILDYRLPDMNGEELLQEIQDSHFSQQPRVLMLSALDDADLKTKWIHMGALAVLKKPFNPFDLLAELRDHFDF
ncbi:MAG: response regulator [Candidatus Marinimicrobia bacterium]|nr:response regulator [Candidatus Neomarinimicrobiota bacterium]